MNITYDKKIYPLEETEMKLYITTDTNINSISIEKLFEIIPINIIINNNNAIATIMLPKINFHDETGIFKIKINCQESEIIKHIMIPREYNI